ncbi:MipA/OmpV family protein [Thiospirillum jenense]|uniref:MipA/OmpV family protein n=1 Tax=Thiospirillum jenense TaxID=1653858 RepID=A0A839H583_9GAMM|nr:MipA/OmpV family protein [Thiospirillum jenense]MBB1125155.1 MipA/OmpV family protein [Thiospirillum jenense]
MAKRPWVLPMLLLSGLINHTSNLNAESLPRWELGIGGGLIQLPDYRGSNETHTYPYPVLLPIYRGEYLRSNTDGIQGIVKLTPKLEFNLSAYGNVPVTNDNAARAGMDDLDPLLEIGAMLRYKTWQSPTQQQAIIVDFPVRTALAIGEQIRQVGYTTAPRISYRHQFNFLNQPWRWSISAEALWSSAALHRYYYQVNSEDATDWRPVYTATAGFAGTRLRTSLYHRQRNQLFSLYAVYDDVSHAVFADSPLVKQHTGLTIGFIMTWFLWQSQETVAIKRWE